jgi:uncharacterized protein YqfA (UPF0365 family)
MNWLLAAILIVLVAHFFPALLVGFVVVNVAIVALVVACFALVGIANVLTFDLRRLLPKRRPARTPAPAVPASEWKA